MGDENLCATPKILSKNNTSLMPLHSIKRHSAENPFHYFKLSLQKLFQDEKKISGHRQDDPCKPLSYFLSWVIRKNDRIWDGLSRLAKMFWTLHPANCRASDQVAAKHFVQKRDDYC